MGIIPLDFLFFLENLAFFGCACMHVAGMMERNRVLIYILIYRYILVAQSDAFRT